MSFPGQFIANTAAFVRQGARLRTRFAAGTLAAAAFVASTATFAQKPATSRYLPLDQTTAPGVAAQWSTAGRRDARPGWQLIRIELPGDEGQVGYYPRPDSAATTFAAPAPAVIMVGSVYRLKLSEMPDYPGVELYPTVELLDRLHPPRGREEEFPVPIAFTDQEIRYAIEGRMITKVIYLEQPNRAIPARNSLAARTRVAGTLENPLALADEEGRPMAIVRLGGRVPDVHSPEPGFFGTGAPIQFASAKAARGGESRP